MKFLNSRKTAIASLALLGLMAWSVEAAADTPCKGKDCPAVKTAKVPAPPAESKPNKDAAAIKLAPSGDGSVRKQATAADGSVRKAVTADGSVRKAVTADGSVRPGTAEAQKVAPLTKTLTAPVPAGK